MRKKFALAAVAAGVLAAVPTVLSVLRYPRINDITTTPDNPPDFKTLGTKPYPPEFIAQQRKGYPDLEPYSYPGSLETLYAAAVETASVMDNWQVVSNDNGAFRLEAVATTPLMRFKDDIVIQVRRSEPVNNENSGAALHMRSRSRVGRGDLGANAAHIRDFIKRLDRRLGE